MSLTGGLLLCGLGVGVGVRSTEALGGGCAEAALHLQDLETMPMLTHPRRDSVSKSLIFGSINMIPVAKTKLRSSC